MIDAILDRVLTVRGVTFLTYFCLVISILVYLRIILGARIIERLRVWVLDIAGGARKKQANNGDGGIKQSLNRLNISPRNQSYDEISMSGGDGRGTVTELLAQQTFENRDIYDKKDIEPEVKINKGACLEFDGYSIGDIYDAPENSRTRS